MALFSLIALFPNEEDCYYKISGIRGLEVGKRGRVREKG
jgi:hypothetical protein